MKIAITGHTNGIGKALCEALEEDHTLFRYSRSNGYDIGKIDQRTKMINEILENDVDIFINNAYAIRAQTELLKTFCMHWQNNPHKLIVHLSSKWIYYPPPDLPEWRLYRKEKQNQHKFLKPNLTTFAPKVMNVIPGPTDTDMVKDWNIPKIPTDKLASLLKNVIELKDSIYVQEMVLDAYDRP